MYNLFKSLITGALLLLIMHPANAQIKMGVVSIPFKFDSYTVESKYLLLLDALADTLKQHPHFSLKIYGFTDTTGTEEYNEMLAQKRIDNVYNYLNAKVPLTQKNTYTNASGEFEERYDMHFPQAHVQERYVDIKISLGK